MIDTIGRPSSRIRMLSGAAGHLCSAYDALCAGGAQTLAGDVLDVLSSIDAVITALEHRAAASTPP
jgi:hypothetical protein